MKRFIIVCSLIALLVSLIFVGVSWIDSRKPPDIDEELSVFIYSASGLDSKECYLIFAGEKPVKAPTDSVVFKFDPQVEKPQVKIWLKEKEVAKRAEIWFKDKDQLREYLR